MRIRKKKKVIKVEEEFGYFLYLLYCLERLFFRNGVNFVYVLDVFNRSMDLFFIRKSIESMMGMDWFDINMCF